MPGARQSQAGEPGRDVLGGESVRDAGMTRRGHRVIGVQPEVGVEVSGPDAANDAPHGERKPGIGGRSRRLHAVQLGAGIGEERLRRRPRGENEMAREPRVGASARDGNKETLEAAVLLGAPAHDLHYRGGHL